MTISYDELMDYGPAVIDSLEKINDFINEIMSLIGKESKSRSVFLQPTDPNQIYPAILLMMETWTSYRPFQNL